MCRKYFNRVGNSSTASSPVPRNEPALQVTPNRNTGEGQSRGEDNAAVNNRSPHVTNRKGSSDEFCVMNETFLEDENTLPTAGCSSFQNNDIASTGSESDAFSTGANEVVTSVGIERHDRTSRPRSKSVGTLSNKSKYYARRLSRKSDSYYDPEEVEQCIPETKI